MSEKRRASNPTPGPGSQLVKRPNLGSSRAAASRNNAVVQAVSSFSSTDAKPGSYGWA